MWIWRNFTEHGFTGKKAKGHWVSGRKPPVKRGAESGVESGAPTEVWGRVIMNDDLTQARGCMFLLQKM